MQINQLYMIYRSYEDHFKAWEIVNPSPAKQFSWIPLESEWVKWIFDAAVHGEKTLTIAVCKDDEGILLQVNTKLKPLVIHIHYGPK